MASCTSNPGGNLPSWVFIGCLGLQHPDGSNLIFFYEVYLVKHLRAKSEVHCRRSSLGFLQWGSFLPYEEGVL